MNFISLAFLLFLLGACLVYFILPKAARTGWLLVCSYLFYLYDPTNAGFLPVLMSATLITYGTGLVLERFEKPIVRKLCLAFSAVCCMGVLAFYKYFSFLAEISSQLFGLFGQKLHVPAFSLAVPLGISYFTFAALGYVIDVYRGARAEKNLFHYALFVSFFPCIMTGPISRADRMLPQFREEHTFEYNRVTGGMFRILWGFFKKLVIADTIGGIVSTIFSNLHYADYTGPVLLIASLLFSYQLYCDFSACTDIAIGAGAIFGIDVMENFRRPLASSSFIELWRRWHISLTSWFRDYLYIPLGGNRKGKLRQNLNQIIVFLISGLWHGASLSYLVWGLLNGVYLCIGKATQTLRRRIEVYNPLYFFSPLRKCIQVCITYLLFTSCIVFFAVGTYSNGILSEALYVYTHLFTGWDLLSLLPATLTTLGFDQTTTLVLLFSFVLVEGLESFQIPMQKLIRRIPFPIRWPLYYSLVLLILFFGAFGQSSFIYQQY
ncbi:MBOAT family protein [uncultured Ruthenibacterium sp.]|uniref:MBOAT family O-acyltransferase n=1 Tax=uncultured Ruthenibacterium sp. TaxID=1905347 RepID=UPI00349E85B5